MVWEGAGAQSPASDPFVRFATESGDDASPEYTVTRNPAESSLRIPSITRKGDVRLSYVSQPDSLVQLQRGTDLKRFEEVDAGTSSPFGTGQFKDELPVPAGLFYAWRLQVALAAALGADDFYHLPIGVPLTLYPGWNDRIFAGSTFALDPVIGPAAALMTLALINPFTSAVVGTVGTFDSTRLTYRIFQNAVFVAAYQTVVIPDLLRLANPPVLRGPNGAPFVPVRCLVIDGKNYPMMQFRLAFAETPRCEDAHWHGSRVYHLDNDTVGIIDPLPNNCGFGPYLSIPQAEVPIPFLQWLLYRVWVLSGALPAGAASSGDVGNGAVTPPVRVSDDPDR